MIGADGRSISGLRGRRSRTPSSTSVGRWSSAVRGPAGTGGPGATRLAGGGGLFLGRLQHGARDQPLTREGVRRLLGQRPVAVSGAEEVVPQLMRHREALPNGRVMGADLDDLADQTSHQLAQLMALTKLEAALVHHDRPTSYDVSGAGPRAPSRAHVRDAPAPRQIESRRCSARRASRRRRRLLRRAQRTPGSPRRPRDTSVATTDVRSLRQWTAVPARL